MKKRKKDSIISGILAVLCYAVLVVALLAAVWSYLRAPIEIKAVGARFSVSDELGIDIDKNALTFFGRLLPGSAGNQNLYISNMREFPVLVKISFTKEIAPYLSTEKEIVLVPGENKSVGFVLNIPRNMSLGNYSGNVILKIYRYDSGN